MLGVDDTRLNRFLTNLGLGQHSCGKKQERTIDLEKAIRRDGKPRRSGDESDAAVWNADGEFRLHRGSGDSVADETRRARRGVNFPLETQLRTRDDGLGGTVGVLPTR